VNEVNGLKGSRPTLGQCEVVTQRERAWGLAAWGQGDLELI